MEPFVYFGKFRRLEKLRKRLGTLYVVATPIGNLEDITLRALRVLKEVPLVAAEDTRVTRTLFRAYDIHTPLASFHEFTPTVRRGRLLERLDEGDVALVTDAGTPGVSDPGYPLVRDALSAGHQVVPVPGASAAMAALMVAGLPTHAFCFEGSCRARAPRGARCSRDTCDSRRDAGASSSRPIVSWPAWPTWWRRSVAGARRRGRRAN